MMSVINRWSLRCEAVTSEDEKHRYILRIEWNKDKPKATVILIQPTTAHPVNLDTTTMNVINNLNQLNYGGCDIVNLFSLVCKKLPLGIPIQQLVREENVGYIQRSCVKSEVVIIAYGSVGSGSKKIMDYQREFLHTHLNPFKQKMVKICGPHTDQAYHPLCPTVRSNWRLVPLFRD